MLVSTNHNTYYDINPSTLHFNEQIEKCDVNFIAYGV